MTGSLEFWWFAGGKAHLVIDRGHGRGFEFQGAKKMEFFRLGLESLPVTS